MAMGARILTVTEIMTTDTTMTTQQNSIVKMMVIIMGN